MTKVSILDEKQEYKEVDLLSKVTDSENTKEAGKEYRRMLNTQINHFLKNGKRDHKTLAVMIAGLKVGFDMTWQIGQLANGINGSKYSVPGDNGNHRAIK